MHCSAFLSVHFLFQFSFWHFIYISRLQAMFYYEDHPIEQLVYFYSWVIVVIFCGLEDLEHSGQHPTFSFNPFLLQGLTLCFIPLTLSPPAKRLSISTVMCFPGPKTHSRKVGMDRLVFGFAILSALKPLRKIAHTLVELCIVKCKNISVVRGMNVRHVKFIKSKSAGS